MFVHLAPEIDNLQYLDDDAFQAVVDTYRADIATEKAEFDEYETNPRCMLFKDELVALENHLTELENERVVARNARLAQSMVNAQLTDFDTMTSMAREEQQAREDHELVLKLDNEEENSDSESEEHEISQPPPTYEETVETTKTHILSKLAGLWVSEEAGKAMYPSDDVHAGSDDHSGLDNRIFQTACVACTDSKTYFEVVKTTCGHEYCKDCLQSLFMRSFHDETLFPPRCCRRNIEPATVEIFMTKSLIIQFEDKLLECHTPDKIYCSNTSCSKFIKPSNITNAAYCDACQTSTCISCKDILHPGDCKEDPDIAATLELAEEEGWRRCGRCKAMVELNTGCYHITCRCSSEFCYLCGVVWKNCECPQWDEYRLDERTAHLVRRAGGNRVVNAHEIRQNLIEQHNCDHEYHRRVQGGECDECHAEMPHFLWQCTNCRFEMCVTCWYNRAR